MSVRFFGTTCSEPSRNDERFGLCDDDNAERAYSDSADQSKWIATVVNEQQRPVVFTGVDHCIKIKKPGTNDDESLCDGMLTSGDQLYLVELKDKKKDWKAEAIGQLENTMRLLKEHEILDSYRFKKGFACNKGRYRSSEIDQELNKRLFHEYGFRADAQANIRIK